MFSFVCIEKAANWNYIDMNDPKAIRVSWENPYRHSEGFLELSDPKASFVLTRWVVPCQKQVVGFFLCTD